METVLLVLEIIGTAAFAVSGAFVGVRRDMDVFGVIILGLTTAVGGGIALLNKGTQEIEEARAEN